MYEAGMYEELVKLLDTKSLQYSASFQQAAGMNSDSVQEATEHRGAAHLGMGAVFVHFQVCADYNSKFQPTDVEDFLAWNAYDSSSGSKGKGYLAVPWQEFSQRLKTAESPMLKAYGLWFCGEYDAYREFVYDRFEEGDESMLGFAVHAAEYDERPFARFDYYLMCVERYEGAFEKGIFDGDVLYESKELIFEGVVIPKKYHVLIRLAVERRFEQLRASKGKYMPGSLVSHAAIHIGMGGELEQLKLELTGMEYSE